MTLDALSAMLRQIYAASRCGDVEQYQRRALEIVAQQIAFDAAWCADARCGLGKPARSKWVAGLGFR